MYWGGAAFGILFWIAVIYIIYLLIKRASWIDKPEEKRNNALHILDERYAKGEIDKAEYEERKKEIVK